MTEQVHKHVIISVEDENWLNTNKISFTKLVRSAINNERNHTPVSAKQQKKVFSQAYVLVSILGAMVFLIGAVTPSPYGIGNISIGIFGMFFGWYQAYVRQEAKNAS